jgi:ParB family chromosome partitioning protein
MKSEKIEASPTELGDSLSSLRLMAPEAEQQMELSLLKLGQLTAVQAYREGSRLETFDGLKRLRAARKLSWTKVRVEVHELDRTLAKVRLMRCNIATGLSELEEAWVVQSLYRDDKLTQGHIAKLLGRVDKSWACRRLALAEELTDELTASVRLGLVSATACRELVRLPRGNQSAVAQVVAQRGLTTRQTSRLVEMLLSSPQDQWPKLLEQSSQFMAPNRREAKGGAPRRTPGEQLVADAWSMKRLAVRLHVRLLERSLQSLGAPACAAVSRELVELRATLFALTQVLDTRLVAQGAHDATN